MPDPNKIKVAIIDYSLGNLFSIKNACEHTGMQGSITSSRQDLLDADAIILPGVGAFKDAMDSLNKLDLTGALHEAAASMKPIIGICLGMQLLMTESYEFGKHKGLGLVEGSVVRFNNSAEKSRKLKVPHVGWNRIFRKISAQTSAISNHSDNDSWSDSPLDGLNNGEFMYFVHSFYADVRDQSSVLSLTLYGNIEFCSSLKYRNIFAFQFHPERSGSQGLQVYRNIASCISRAKEARHARKI